MIKICIPHSSFYIQRLPEGEGWGTMLDERRYVIQTRHQRSEVDIDGFRAAFGVATNGFLHLSQDEFDHLDATINDLLGAWQTGQTVIIDLTKKPLRYGLEVDGERRIDSPHYIDLSRYMSDAAFRKVIED